MSVVVVDEAEGVIVVFGGETEGVEGGDVGGGDVVGDVTRDSTERCVVVVGGDAI